MRWFFCLILILTASPAYAGPKVIASIMPVHSIVSAVMGDTGKPELLLSGKFSEHTASFTASQISELGQADVVFLIGHGLEAKLSKLGGSEAVGGRKFIELAEAPGVKTLGVREGGGWDIHEHGEDESGHEEQAEGVLAFDPHVWLDPENAKAMANAVAAELSAADPGNAAAYKTNAQRFAEDIDAVSTQIAAQLAGVKDKPFIVFHDAYQYFEKRFGLSAAGSIADISAAPPSARRLKEIRDKLAATGAVCVFREPQFDAKFVETVIEGSNARLGVLDPLGAELEPGTQAYSQLLRNLSASIEACLRE